MLSLCVCEIIVVVYVREAAGGGGARDTESKTRTPHKDVGNKHQQTMHETVGLSGFVDTACDSSCRTGGPILQDFPGSPARRT